MIYYYIMTHQQVLKIYVEDKDLKAKYIDHISEHNTKVENDEYSDSGFDLLTPELTKINNKAISYMIDLKVKTALVTRNLVPHEINYNHSLAYGGSLFALFILLNQMVLGLYVSLLISSALLISDNSHLVDTYVKYNYIETPLPFMILPRSSTGKNTPLRLSNNTGIIDKGYRGNIMACVDNVKNTTDYEDISIFSSKSTESNEDSFTIEQYKKLFQIVAFSGESLKVELVNNLKDLKETSRGEDGFGSTDSIVEVFSDSEEEKEDEKVDDTKED